MYAKIFESIFDGSLRKDWKALVTFQQLLILCDREGFIDKTPDAIASRTSIPLDLIEHGLKLLGAPDPDSRSQEEEGRRIVLINPARKWGWRIVNYASYRDIRSQEELRGYWANQKREQRQEKLSDRTLMLKQKISAAYKRGPSDPWSYAEECALAEVARRENCLTEADELITFRPKRGKYFPHSIGRLLDTWAAVLDAARNGTSQTEDLKLVIKLLEERIETHPANPSFCGNNSSRRPTPEQTAELAKLRARLKALKTEITDAVLNA